MKTLPHADDLSDLTPAEQCVFHSIRKRVAEFRIRLVREAQKRGELPTSHERMRRTFDAGRAEDFRMRRASR